MDDTNKRVVEGYWFGSDKEAELARTECDKVRFLEERICYEDIQSVLVIYQRAIENRIFQTPVGMDYLRKLQCFLKERQSELGEAVRDIPVYTPVSSYVSRPREEARRKEELKQAQDNYKTTKRQLRISLFLNIALILLAISMFGIAISTDNPNILNYKMAVENEYSQWEQDLTGREQKIREKEKELNIQR